MDAYLRTRRTTAKPRGGDRRSGRIEAQAELLLVPAVRETPDITLAELRERLIAERGETFALSTIHDFYRRHGIDVRKDGACERAGAQDVKAARREAWFDRQPDLDPEKLVFIDETGATTKMARLRGRAGAASAAAPPFRTVTGRRPHWSPACASTGSPPRWSSTAR